MTDLIDQSVLSELSDIMGDDMALLVSTFVTDSKGKFDLLSQAIEDQDWETTYRTAHSLKGSSRNLGAVQLATCLEKLEKDARAGQTESIAELLQIARSLFQRSCEAISQS